MCLTDVLSYSSIRVCILYAFSYSRVISTSILFLNGDYNLFCNIVFVKIYEGAK